MVAICGCDTWSRCVFEWMYVSQPMRIELSKTKLNNRPSAPPALDPVMQANINAVSETQRFAANVNVNVNVNANVNVNVNVNANVNAMTMRMTMRITMRVCEVTCSQFDESSTCIESTAMIVCIIIINTLD